MLINFKVQNFKSFQEVTELSMVASSHKRHASHVREIKSHRILKSSFVFGANASGKSNLIEAIAFAQTAIQRGLDTLNCDQLGFRLNPHKKDDVGIFQFTFIANHHIYEYGIALSYSKVAFVAEWLILMDDVKKSEIIFSCDWSETKKIITTDINLKDEDKLRFDVYSQDAQLQSNRKGTFLHEIAGKGIVRNSTTFFTHFQYVYQWMQQLVVIFPKTKYGNMGHYVSHEQDRAYLSQQLHYFDTGIDELKTRDVKPDAVFVHVPQHIRDQIKADLIDDLTTGKMQQCALTFGDHNYLATFQDGKLHFKELVALHGPESEIFTREDESDGTKRLYDLLPLHQFFQVGGVVLIDEFDRSLHTKASLEFIKLFFERSKENNAQLIATTHNDAILDLALLRQDEIWFVERDVNHVSHLYPLTKFKVRFDKDIQADYLIGRYGALPIFRTALGEDKL